VRVRSNYFKVTDRHAEVAYWRSRLSRAADGPLQNLVMASQGAVVASWWHHPLSKIACGAVTQWLKSLPGDVVELRCRCRPTLPLNVAFRANGMRDIWRASDPGPKSCASLNTSPREVCTAWWSWTLSNQWILWLYCVPWSHLQNRQTCDVRSAAQDRGSLFASAPFALRAQIGHQVLPIRRVLHPVAHALAWDHFLRVGQPRQ